MSHTEIRDLDHPGLEVFTALNEPQLYHYYEPEPGLFIAETPNVIRRALAAGYEPMMMLCEDGLADEADRILVNNPDIPVYLCPLDVMKRLTGYSLTHGMLCALKRRAPEDPVSMLRHLSGKKDSSGRIAVLENVVNPTNAGAIFRSAAGLGIDAILLTEDCADPLQRRCARVSMGTVFQIPWTYITGEWISMLHREGYRLAAMALKEDSLTVSDPVLKKEDRLAIVLGSEGYGLKEETIDSCDHTVLIPMCHGVDSLNVAAAGAVVFWELRRRNV